MNDDKVFRLLVETNPVPDPDGLDSPLGLIEIERRSPTMATDERISTELTRTKPVRGGNRLHGPLLGVAAAVLVLIIGIGTWAVIGGNQDAADGSEVSVVLSHYEAMNNGDIDGWFATLTEKAAAAESRDTQQLFVNMNSQTEFVEPCRLIEPSPTTGLARVQCKVSVTDDYHDPGGIQMIRVGTFAITDTGKIDVVIGVFDSESGTESVFYAYNRDFWQWLAIAHPDVADAITPSDGQSLPGWQSDPADVFTALDHIDEFIAQSDVYPLTDTITP
jgi:hypothetical protein